MNQRGRKPPVLYGWGDAIIYVLIIIAFLTFLVLVPNAIQYLKAF